MVKRRFSRKVARAVSKIAHPKLSQYRFAHAAGIVSLVSMAVLALMAWFGNYDGSIVAAQYPIPFSFNNWTVVIGLIQTYAISYILGWIFVKVYNR